MPETCIRYGEHGARVLVEDKEIQHYAMHVDPAKKEVSCWIASEAGKTFSIEWLGLDVEYPSAGQLYLDGYSSRRISRGCHTVEPSIFRYGFVSSSSLAPFLFSKLDVTDDDAYLDISPSHSIGEIRLVIDRTTPRIEEKKQVTTYQVPPDLQKVHERSKKAIAHRVNYGSEIPRTDMKTYTVKTLETLITFIFRYRPLEILRANEIVPRNPEPLEPQEHTLDTLPSSETSSGKGEQSNVKREAESEPETDDEDEDDIREKALMAELEKIRKGKQLKDSKRPKKKFKKEEKPFFTPGEIIDLT